MRPAPDQPVGQASYRVGGGRGGPYRRHPRLSPGSYRPPRRTAPCRPGRTMPAVPARGAGACWTALPGPAEVGHPPWTGRPGTPACTASACSPTTARFDGRRAYGRQATAGTRDRRDGPGYRRKRTQNMPYFYAKGFRRRHALSTSGRRPGRYVTFRLAMSPAAALGSAAQQNTPGRMGQPGLDAERGTGPDCSSHH